MRGALWVFVAALLVCSVPAFAGSATKGDWEIGGYGGYGWLDEYGGLLPKDNALFGGRLGYFLTRHWSVEASAQRLPTERDTVGGADTEIKLDAFRFNVLYNLGAGKTVRPFLTAGLGSERVKVEGFDTDSQMGWNIGGGFRFALGEHVCIRTEGRYVRSHIDDIDESEGNVEATAGLSLLFGGDDDEGETAVETAAPVRENQPPSVTCAPDRQEVLPGESVRIVVTASDPDGDPLTYEYTTSSGKVVGTGNTAMLDFTGVTGPGGGTVTVRVSDDHGHSTTCDATVRLMEAQKPAESISCLAGGFPRNLSRLTNVDKACLDDIASRLKGDPRAKVVVIGHADTRETSKDRVATQRADAVKDYLVQAGVEASRITTRSAGDTKTLGGDAAGNRRVEVWFVPEGAREPE